MQIHFSKHLQGTRATHFTFFSHHSISMENSQDPGNTSTHPILTSYLSSLLPSEFHPAMGTTLHQGSLHNPAARNFFKNQ